MNYIKKILIIFFLIITLVYTVNITNIPEKIILFEDEKLSLGEAFGITLKEKPETIIQTSMNEQSLENKTITVSLFNIIDVKKVQVNTVKKTRVVPLGNTIGIKLYSDGVLVIGMTEIEGKKPYENTGIKEGDLIKAVDNIEISTTEELVNSVNASQGKEIEIKYLREGTEYTANIEPVKTKEEKYKIGLWVRDGAVGIGTATYYEPQSKKVATLGHGIIDRDTDKLITIESGELLTSTITKIKKGEKGNPGEIRGIINENQIIGTINKNTEFGIYGKLDQKTKLGIKEENTMEVALINEIETGKASILLTLEDGIKKEYEIKIKKIYKNNTENNKSMLIEITDNDLIEKTGGIIQGMSGAPIIQNGKFIRSNNTRTSKQSARRLRSLRRNNAKTNVISQLGTYLFWAKISQLGTRFKNKKMYKKHINVHNSTINFLGGAYYVRK